ncbi:MAG: two component transcriptional regulator, Fis family [Myxococcales bacterium]|nr:two component transcriptional regulator, Fis family [Myxococcales bacterium]
MAQLAARSIRTVLAVDDDETLLAALVRSLGHNRTILTATTPAAARTLAKTRPPDLAIVDMRIGSSSGIELIRNLKSDLPNTVIALISGYLSVESTVAAVRAGADVILCKPVTAREILRRVEQGMPEDPDRDETPTLARAETEHIARVIADCHGNLSEAARRLGIYRSSLQRRLRKHSPRG